MSDSSQSVSSHGPLPIAVGVVGHRDIRPEDRSALQERVRGLLAELRHRYPSSPLVVLSALAEGADRLVAEVALQLGFRLIVPLPMEPEEYVKDFPNSLTEFDGLLARAAKSFSLAPPDEHRSDDSARRSHCYAFAGAYIARHCQILLALWDGHDTCAVGGTAHVVRFKRAGVDPPYGPPRSPLDPVEGSIVYHLITPRLSLPATKGQPLALVKLVPDDESADIAEAERAQHRVLSWIDEFNRDACRLSPALHAELRQSREHVFSEPVEAKLPAPVRSGLALYAVADVLALHFARRTLWALRVLLVLAFAATLMFQLYAFVANKPLALLFAYIGLAYVACPATYLWARYVGDYQNKYLDYRALAEGLRVLLFWRLAGLKIQVADHYLRKQRSEMDWIRQAIRGSTLPVSGNAESAVDLLTDGERLKLVLTHWVADQARFFRRRSQKDRTAARRFSYIGLALYVLGVILPLGKLVSESEHPVILVMSLTVVLAALVHVYSRVLGFDEHANQYERMGRVFGKAEKHLQAELSAGRLETVRTLIRELGQEALIENGEWLLFHRRQPVQVPGGLGAE